MVLSYNKIQFLVKGDETFDLDINQIKDEKFCKAYFAIKSNFWVRVLK